MLGFTLCMILKISSPLNFRGTSLNLTPLCLSGNNSNSAIIRFSMQNMMQSSNQPLYWVGRPTAKWTSCQVRCFSNKKYFSRLYYSSVFTVYFLFVPTLDDIYSLTEKVKHVFVWLLVWLHIVSKTNILGSVSFYVHLPIIQDDMQYYSSTFESWQEFKIMFCEFVIMDRQGPAGLRKKILHPQV